MAKPHWKSLNNGIFLELSKADDCMPHDLMVDKLEAYGLAKEILQLTSNYLRTKISSTYSDWTNVIRGIP